MATENFIRPLQTIPLKTKLSKGKKGKEWRQACVDYYADIDIQYQTQGERYDQLYALGEGYINEDSYTYVTNPININKSKGNKLPSKLRNYDIISPIVEMLMGEKIKRTLKPIVYAANSDITTVREQAERQMINQELNQVIINGLNDLGLDTGFESRDLATHEQILMTVDSIKDDKAMTGQHSLNYIIQDSEVYKEHRKTWFDTVNVGQTVTYKDVINDEIQYKAYSPKYLTYLASEDTDFVEDGEAACIRMQMTVSDIIDKFWEDLDEEEIKKLQKLYDLDTGAYDYGLNTSIDKMFQMFDESGRLNYSRNEILAKNVQVDYVNWKSLVKVGKVTKQTVVGEPIEYFVQEGYIQSEGEEIEWKWVNQVWEGYKIYLESQDNVIYTRIRPIPFQRGKFNNPSSSKLLINGFNLFSRNYKAKSIVEKLEPYQSIYNVIHWHIEKLINKNKDKVILMPYDLVPDNDDYKMEDMFYYADADGFLFPKGDLDAKELQQMQYGIKVLDLSLSQYIKYLEELLIFIKSEADELVGAVRQRRGQMYATDGKATAEQAIYQGSIMTENYFKQQEEFEVREYQGLLDLSKFAWRNGKKAWYTDSDKRRVLLNVQGSQHRESEYGIFVGNSSDEKEKKDIIKSNAQSFVQNGMTPDVLTKLLNSDNLEEMMDILEIDRERVMQEAQQAQQAEQEAEMQSKQIEAEQQDKELQFKYDELESNETLKLLELEQKYRESAINSASSGNDELASKQLAEANKMMVEREKLLVKREEIASKERIAEKQMKTQLRNKVVGEK